MNTIARTLLAACLATSLIAAAQSYPSRAVTIGVPFPPGGGTDTGTRIVATKLSQKWGQPVVVENKGGAAGMVGAEQVSKAKPDGYTLLMGNVGTQSINPTLYGKRLPYNADTSFVPVTLVAELPLVMVAGPATQSRTPAEVLATARANPGKVTYASSGPGGAPHLAGALFESQSKAELLHVPDSVPDTPTLAESGLPGFNSGSWIGLVAPARRARSSRRSRAT